MASFGFAAAYFFGVFPFANKSINVCGKEFSASDTEFVFSGCDLSDISSFDSISDASLIDLRNTNISFDDVQKIREKFPDTVIKWNVSLGGRKVDCDETTLTLSDCDIEYIDNLSQMADLRQITAYGLPYDAVEKIENVCPNVDVQWDTVICDVRYTNDAEEIVLDETATADDAAGLVRFKKLKKVDASGCIYYKELVSASDVISSCDFTWTGNFGGVIVDNHATLLDFKRKKITDVNKLSSEFENLKYFKNIKRVDMSGCGVPDKQMAQWRSKYPDNKFVWEVTFGNKRRKWTVKTDIKVFSTLLGSGASLGDEKDYKNLFLYCTDLVALDLGHNVIKDISLISNLKKLQGLIITDNKVSDLSSLTKLPDFVFLEANMNSLKNVKPLGDCPKLIHADFYFNNVSDISALKKCKDLKTLVVVSNKTTKAQRDAVKKALPNCQVVNVLDANGKKHRNDSIRNAFRLAFVNYKQIEDFVDWEHVTYKKGAVLKYPRGYSGPKIKT